jgi:hypothetical protein
MWFTQAEAQFSLAGITTERTKFYHMISQLDHRYAAEVRDIIISPPPRDPYTTLHTELLERLSPSGEQRLRQLLTPEAMGDRKPSQYLRHLRSLALDASEKLLRAIWSNKLPRHIQLALAAQSDVPLDAAARCADRMTEAISRPELASIGATAKTDLVKQMEDLTGQVAALRAHWDRRSSSRDRHYNQKDRPSSPRHRRLNNSSPSRLDNATGSCWYHRRFGDRAQNYTQPCSYREQGN